MPIVVVNDVEVEAEVGENLLDIARRCAAHFGFACGGLGICLSCVCHVRKGLEHLSPPTNAERRGMPKPWLDRGHRVACQVTLTGPGPVEIISRPEELFRLAKASLKPPEGTDRTQSILDLTKFVLDMSLQQWLAFPMSSINAIYQASKARPTPNTIARVVTDTGRVLRHMTNTPDAQEDLEEEEEVTDVDGMDALSPQEGDEPGSGTPRKKDVSIPISTQKKKEPIPISTDTDTEEQ